MNRSFFHRRGGNSRVLGLTIMVPRCRALRSHNRLDCFANIHNWNLVVYAVREQRIVPSMMVNLSASLGFIVLNFRPVVNRFLHLLTTGRFLWFGSRR